MTPGHASESNTKTDARFRCLFAELAWVPSFSTISEQILVLGRSIHGLSDSSRDPDLGLSLVNSQLTLSY